jgi:predicted transcriptional regulator
LPKLASMEVHFTTEQEAQLSKIATTTGTDAEQLVKEAALRLLQEETRFVEAVKLGETQLDRGEYLTHEEVGESIERLFRS